MKKYYNNTKYDTAFDRWTGIVSELMMKYVPHVLARQKRIIEASKPVNEIQQNPEKRRIA
ncbi:MAG: hypothetical protein J6O00_09410 [Clostridiales bacterium]|nr:hypothetical protein [Clostridiales bacterium]